MPREDQKSPSDEDAEHLRALAWGYIPAALIGVIIDLEIPDLLGDGTKPISELAASSHAHEEALYRMLRALASFGILTELAERRFALTSAGRRLRSDVPGSLRGYIRWATDPFLFRCYAGLMHSAKTGEAAVGHVFGASLFRHLQIDSQLSGIFNEGMSSFSQMVSSAVLEAYDFSGIKIIADVAGGEGALVAAILEKHSALRGLLLDQEHVVPGARKRMETLGLTERCRCSSIDFFESIPPGADTYLMKSIIHDWDDQRAGLILRNCSEALRSAENGKLLLVEAVIPSGNDMHPVKIYDMQMLVLTGGRERTCEEFQSLLAESGFRLTRVIPTRSFVSVVEAVPQ